MGIPDETRYEANNEFTNYEDADSGTANVDSKLINPFKGKRPEQMESLIEAFMEKTKIEEIYSGLIRKGAFLAQDKEAFDHPRTDGLQLNQEERSALEREDPKTGNKWDQPWIMYALVGCCSLGAAVQGWDETAVVGVSPPITSPWLGFII